MRLFSKLRLTLHTILLHTILRQKDIGIKRHFSYNFFSCVNWKYLFLDNYAYWNLVWNDFKMSPQYFEEKNIFLSKCLCYLFIEILSAKIIVCDVGLSEICSNIESDIISLIIRCNKIELHVMLYCTCKS